ncbi:MAG: DUF4350 domain-containing protein [Candidatus Hodarchaeota archaeon]
MEDSRDKTRAEQHFSNAVQIILRRSFWFPFVIVLLILPFFIPVHFSPPLSDHNGWNGTSEFRKRLQEDYQVKSILTSPTTLSDNDPALLIIMGAERAYSEAEIRAIEFFIFRGGSLLICDDFGPGRAIASHFGVDFRSGKLLETNSDTFVRNPRFPIIQLTSSIQTELDIEAEEILLNDASALSVPWWSGEEEEDSWKALLGTTNTAFLDSDDDGNLDHYDESQGVYVVFAANWDARIAVLADASIAANEMLSLTEFQNYLFIKGIIDRLAGSLGRILIDDSHRAWIPVGASGYVATVLGWCESVIFSPLYVVALSLALSLILVLPYLLQTYSKRKRTRGPFLSPTRREHVIQPPLTVEEEIITGLFASSEVLGMKSFLQLYSELLLKSLIDTERYADEDSIKVIKELLKSPRTIEEYYTVINHLYGMIEANEGLNIQDIAI